MKDARSSKITPGQHSILEYIFFGKNVTTSQVADCLNISLPNASREWKKLSELDLIKKAADKTDKRKAAISLSESGQLLMQSTFKKIEKNFWQKSGELSDQEMASMVTAMKTLQEKLFFTPNLSAREESDTGTDPENRHIPFLHFDLSIVNKEGRRAKIGVSADDGCALCCSYVISGPLVSFHH